jgi:hypothetical protein
MMKLRWAILFTALTVFLTACPEPVKPVAAKITLGADPTSLTAAGGPVKLTATIDEGTVTSVDFLADGASVGVDSDGSDGFSVTNTVAANAGAAKTIKYVAAGTTTSGTVNSNEVSVSQAGTSSGVTLTLAATPNPVPTAGAPVKLDATITAGADKVKSVEFSIKDQTTVLKKVSAAPYTFTTTTPVTVATTFVATAKDAAGVTLGTPAEVAVTVGAGPAVPAGATIAATLADIRDATDATPATGAAATIVLTTDITCDRDPCIKLLAGQKLLGANAEGKNLLTTPTRKITTNGSGARVIEMANNTEVGGFDFVGTGIYNAVDSPATITGSVTIKNIKIGVATLNAPLILKSKGAVTIEGLEIPNTTRTTDIEGFSSLTVTRSTISYTLPPLGPTGPTWAFLAASKNGTISIDGLTITSNLSDPTIFNPFFVNQILGAGTLNVTVKNSRVVVPAGAGTATARSFVFGVDVASTGTVVLDTTPNTTVSTGNTTNAGAGVTTSTTGVTGTIGLAVQP